MDNVEIQVFLEDQQRFITLQASRAVAERAQIDPQFLEHLVKPYRQSSESETWDTSQLCTQLTQSTAAPSALQTSERCTQVTGGAAPCEQPDTCEAAKDTSLFIWSQPCIKLLLHLYEECAAEFVSGGKRHNKIWKEIAEIMDKNGHKVTGPQCQGKLNSLKKTYKKIIDHNNSSGNDRLTWPYFDKMNEIFGATSWANPVALATEAGPSSPLPHHSPKKRKLSLVEKMSSNFEERQKRKQEWQQIKANKIDELMQQRERQHREKMDLMNTLIQSLRK